MKETPGPNKAEPSALDNAHSKAPKKSGVYLSGRQQRLLDALLTASGWVFRESVDHITGASNGPQVVMELRRKLTGQDGIDMERVDAKDRFGEPCKPGRYRLTALGRNRVYRVMNGQAGESA